MKALGLLGALGLALGASLAAPALPTSLSASLPVVGAAPAAAAGCAGPGGVTVVVDYNQLGGATLEGCVANGGGRVARGVFTDAGAAQTDVQRTRGFVCRVNAKPTQQQDRCVNTPPSTAYWSLWWTDGKGGPWVYSSLGVDSLTVPDGGYLAWSWQGQQAKSPPGVTPRARAASSPSGGAGGGGGDGSRGGSGEGGAGGSGDGGAPSGGSTPTPDRDPTASPGASGGAGEPNRSGGTAGRNGGRRGEGRADNGSGRGDADGAKGGPGGKNGRNGKNRRGGRAGADGDGGAEESESSPLTDADGNTEQVSSASEEDPSGLPVWVPLAVIAVLGAGGVGAVLMRRRTGGST